MRDPEKVEVSDSHLCIARLAGPAELPTHVLQVISGHAPGCFFPPCQIHVTAAR